MSRVETKLAHAFWGGKKKSLWSDQAVLHIEQCGLPKRQLKLAGG